MIIRVFSIYDKKAEGYRPPFAVGTIGEAERAFLDACREEGTDLYKHPEDYSLWLVGLFDQLSGEIVAEHTHLVNGMSYDISGGERE